MKRVIIMGNSGNTPDLIDIIDGLEGHTCVGILDDNPLLHGKTVYGVQVLGPIDSGADYPDCFFVNAVYSISARTIRAALIQKAGVEQDRFITLIHPTASISPSASIGRGTVILANVTVCANAVIGRHCVVLPNSVLNHDVVIADHVSIASCVGLAGAVKVEEASYIGMGAQIRERLTVGAEAVVAMGAIVTADVPPGETVLGCPARPARPHAG
jgi:sugar O-acyltransferase (sialic acid O-acetyltransferase NeuD family)